MNTITILICVTILISAIWMSIGAYRDDMSVIFTGMILLFGSIALICQIKSVVGSSNKSKFYNTLYKTNYSAEDIYCNEDMIKNYLVGEKKNINLNINGEK